jgi:hypothetical protein
MDVPRLFRLWHDYSIANEELMKLLDVSPPAFYRLRLKYSLPRRPIQCWRKTNGEPDDPTTEEIAERAAECRQKWSAAERVRRNCHRTETWTPPQYHFATDGILTGG